MHPSLLRCLFTSFMSTSVGQRQRAADSLKGRKLPGVGLAVDELPRRDAVLLKQPRSRSRAYPIRLIHNNKTGSDARRRRRTRRTGSGECPSEIAAGASGIKVAAAVMLGRRLNLKVRLSRTPSEFPGSNKAKMLSPRAAKMVPVALMEIKLATCQEQNNQISLKSLQS